MPTQSAIENAIAVAVRAASGLSSGQVFWAGQGKTIPTGAYISMQMGDFAESQTAVPVRTTAYSATPVGEEITHSIRDSAEFTVSIQVFTPTVIGNSSAKAIARDIRKKFHLASVRDPLIAAGVGLLSPGAIKGLDEIKGTKFEGRAILEPRFYILDTATETTTYIETLGPLKNYTQPPTGNPDIIDI